MHKLLKLHHGNRHQLLDGNPRCLAVVEVELRGGFLISSKWMPQPHSTQLLRLTSQLGWQVQLKLLEEELTKKSLHRPSKRLKKLCCKDGHLGVPHSNTKSVDKGLSSKESAEDWAVHNLNCCVYDADA
ncbi:Tn7-like element transposition protein TnsE [Aeromonas dhakensis]|uniref:Tn7-like element transposition protein TnsE n=1 Tax=Aeromonas TaxID=642 RepID=UPI00227BE94B|nr:Tn7-like element transposition protein TnsE [Aeromonas dhakensis]WAF76848.1 Tn7-like element transposition protein TnsE [Aeromonas dhakensis]